MTATLLTTARQTLTTCVRAASILYGTTVRFTICTFITVVYSHGCAAVSFVSDHAAPNPALDDSVVRYPEGDLALRKLGPHAVDLEVQSLVAYC